MNFPNGKFIFPYSECPPSAAMRLRYTCASAKAPSKRGQRIRKSCRRYSAEKHIPPPPEADTATH